MFAISRKGGEKKCEGGREREGGEREREGERGRERETEREREREREREKEWAWVGGGGGREWNPHISRKIIMPNTETYCRLK